MRKKLAKLYFVTLENATRTPEEQVEAFCKAGGELVQVRLKTGRDQTVRGTAERCLDICRQYDVTCLMNDRVQLAVMLGFDGVHLGQGDETPERARRILGQQAIVGGTANTWEEAAYMIEQGVDYLGVGPFQPTTTKAQLAPILGLEGYQQLQAKMEKEQMNCPIYAIGGIRESDVEPLMRIGIYGVALSGDIARAESIQVQTKRYLKRLTGS
ncbi:MAG: thiamine phosphate synthase [Bacteroidota bacterium]